MSLLPDLQMPYYLTRQSANVMEDLSTQIKQPGIICLLYGENGVGKTRLLHQFIATRLSNSKVVLIRFNANGHYLSSSQPGQSFQTQGLVLHQLEGLDNHCVLVLDQLEHVGADVLAQLLHFWSREGKLKDLKLVLSTTPSALKQLVEISKKYHLSINSLELKPLSANEQIEFIASRCCASRDEQPVLSRQQKKQLNQTRGIYSQLELLQQQWGKQIRCESNARAKTLTTPAVMVSILILFGLILWLVYPWQSSVKQIPAVIDIKQQPEAQNITPQETIESTPPVDGHQPPVIENSSSESQVALNDEPEIADSNRMDSQQSRLEREKLPKENSNNTPETDHVVTEVEPAPSEQNTSPNLFQQRLSATQDWLASAPDSMSSIQIMTLGFNGDPEQSITQYLQQLRSKGVKLNQVMIYTTRKNNRSVMGVLYGIYPNREQAKQNMDQLPGALRANKPLPRTVKGIKDEINRDSL